MEPGRREALRENARSIRAPALLLTFDDDAFVGEYGCNRFVQVIPDARPIRRHLSRCEFPGGRAGHWSFFQRRNRSLWALVLRFLRTPARFDGSSLACSESGRASWGIR
jgi:predicted alpha/beta hydrolase